MSWKWRKTVRRPTSARAATCSALGATWPECTISIIARPVLGTTWRERVLDMAGRRTQAFEKISPYKRAADVFRHRSKFLGSDYLRLVAELREALRRELPAEIAGDADRFEALDMVMSYETWSRLRREQDLAADRAQAVVEAAVRRLIA